MLNWRFNGWAKYANSEHDDAVTAALATQLGLADVDAGFGTASRWCSKAAASM